MQTFRFWDFIIKYLTINQGKVKKQRFKLNILGKLVFLDTNCCEQFALRYIIEPLHSRGENILLIGFE